MRVRRAVNKNRFWEVNILTSVILFLILYVVFASKLFIGQLVGLLFGPEHITVFGRRLMSENVFIGLEKYGRDFILGYALYIAVAYWLKRDQYGIKYAAMIAMAAEVVIELVRMLTVLSTVEYTWNLAASLLGTGFAVLAVLLHERRLF